MGDLMSASTGRQLDPELRSVESRDFEAGLRRKIVGQDEAVQAVVDLYQVFRAGLNSPGRPVGNLLFLGPTGAGKTRVVEANAEVVFGDPRAVIKVDFAEFQHSHEIAKLVGSPPGYLGHRETHPMFTQGVLDQYHNEKYKLGIVLFDEIEKASDSLWTLLLGVLDNATLTCGDNTKVNFSQQIIVMTSNLGVSELSEVLGERIGFLPCTVGVTKRKTEDIVLSALKKKFTPEFLNRIDNTVVFNTLTEADCKEIMAKELGKALYTVHQASTTFFQLTAAAQEQLFLEGYSKEYGARNLKRIIEKRVTLPLAKVLSSDQVKEGEKTTID